MPLVAPLPQFPLFYCVKHPLVAHKLSLLRDKKTPAKIFRELVAEITLLIAYEATQDLSLNEVSIATPLETMLTPMLKDRYPVIVPILRAGLGMTESFLQLIPEARVGHIGLYRDEETLQPTQYYFKIPQKSEDSAYFVCDPMLATGGSIAKAISLLKERGIHRITLVCLVAVPEGVQVVATAHPDVKIYTASFDRELNEQGYILPGLGDAGDRLFGTK
ncbi:MAG: Uracil phosphoribosyl transferase [Gammaproteobacteria bacterium]|jgi:uracil phosphoribosyltransferase|nr:Uracil phosphoribosyl transferase [Gammaproteobacteria bacterium]